MSVTGSQTAATPLIMIHALPGAVSTGCMEHQRPDTARDDAIAAAGKMTEALETLERARGHLYSFHQLVGEADLKLDEALAGMRACGAGELAERVERELVGRNVLPDRWTFQIIEEFDDG